MNISNDQYGDQAKLGGNGWNFVTIGDVKRQLGKLDNPQLELTVRDILQLAGQVADMLSACQGGQLQWGLSDAHARLIADFIDQLPSSDNTSQMVREMSNLRSKASGLHFAKEMLKPPELEALEVLESLISEWDRYNGGYAHQLLNTQRCMEVADLIKKLVPDQETNINK